MKIRTYIINLKESIERRRHMIQEVCKFPFMDVEWIDAINGAGMKEEDIDEVFNTRKFTNRYFRPPAKGEIGCTLSHRKCYKHLLTTNEPYALILEDDVSFNRPKDTEYVLTQGIRLLEEGKADIVLFATKILLYNQLEKLELEYAVGPVYIAYGTYSYLINQKACKRLLKKNREDTVADDYQAMRSLGLKIKSIYPSITNELSNSTLIQSTIEQERKEAIKKHLKCTLGQRMRIYSEIIYCRLAIKCGWMIERGFYSSREQGLL